MSFLMHMKKKLKSYNKTKKQNPFQLPKRCAENVDVQEPIMSKDRPDLRIRRQHYSLHVWTVETNGIKIEAYKQEFSFTVL
jgi:hypothetical protein